MIARRHTAQSKAIMILTVIAAALFLAFAGAQSKPLPLIFLWVFAGGLLAAVYAGSTLMESSTYEVAERWRWRLMVKLSSAFIGLATTLLSAAISLFLPGSNLARVDLPVALTVMVVATATAILAPVTGGRSD